MRAHVFIVRKPRRVSFSQTLKPIVPDIFADSIMTQIRLKSEELAYLIGTSLCLHIHEI